MKIPTLLLVLLVGLIPLLILTFIVVSSSLAIVAWQPANLWTTEFGPGNFDNAANSLSLSSNTLYLGGHFTSIPDVNSSASGLFVAGYDLSGRQTWIRMFGDKDSVLSAVGIGKSVVIAGGLYGQGFVRAFDINGTVIWNTRFSNSTQDNVLDVSIGGSLVYAAGYYRLTNGSFVDELQALDVNGRSLWNVTTPGQVALYASSAGIYAFGKDIQLFNPAGIIQWTRPLDCTSCVVTDLSGDATAIYAAGYVASQYLFFLNKYDLAGNKLWNIQLASSYPAGREIGMAADPSGIYVSIQGLNGGGTIMKFDNSGGQTLSFATKARPIALVAGSGTLYIGGAIADPSVQASLAAYSQSSSLIFLGLNPPFSFGIVALLAAVVVAVVWRLKRSWPRADASKKPYHLVKGAPKDALRLWPEAST